MRFRGVLAAVCGMVALGTPASAMAKYAFCKTHAPHQSVRVTPVFEYPARVGSNGIDPDFESYIEAKVGFNVYPSCLSYDDEAHARKMQAYTLAETAQGLPAILDLGFENYLAQKYGAGRKAGPAPAAVADGAGQNDTSKAVTPVGPSAAQLSAERHKAVEERNRAAQAKYEAELAAQKRKAEEYERAKEEVARKKAEQQAAAQQAMDSFKAEQAAHAQQMLQHQQQVSDYQNKLAQQGSKPPAKGGGRFQATSAIVDTREAAMAALMRLPVPGPLTDIQCGEVKMFSPPKWTCWGFYQADVKPSGASAQ